MDINTITKNTTKKMIEAFNRSRSVNDFNQYRELQELGALVDANPTVQGYKGLFQAQMDHLNKFIIAAHARKAEQRKPEDPADI